MHSLKDKIIRGFAIVGNGLRLFWRKPTTLLFLLLAISLITGAIALCAFVLYHTHGIHIFDERTLEEWWILSFWEKSLLAALLLAPLYFSSELIVVFTNTALMRHLVQHNKKRYGIFSSLVHALKTMPRILEWAWVKTIWHIIREPYIKKIIKRKTLAHWAQRLHEQTIEINWFEHTFLVIPILTLTSQKPNQASNSSSLLMEQQFGARAQAQFSLFPLYLILALWVAFPLTYWLSSPNNQALTITIFFVVMGCITAIIETTVGIFKLDTYKYCNNQKPILFESRFINSSFKESA